VRLTHTTMRPRRRARVTRVSAGACALRAPAVAE
jgi:hypothetical protein